MYTPSNITLVEAISKELEEVQSFLEAHYNADNPAAVMDRFDQLAVYMARTGKLKADAEHHYNALVESSIFKMLEKSYEERLSASTINKFIESAARNYKFLFTWAERCNRSCTHQYDGMRTVISSLRAEFNASKFGR